MVLAKGIVREPEAGAVPYAPIVALLLGVVPGPVRRLHWPIADPSAAGDIAAFRTARDQVKGRIAVLSRLVDLPEGPKGTEFDASLRVRDLTESPRFYGWLLNTWAWPAQGIRGRPSGGWSR